jgi:DNA polymerase-3 subunit delta'
VEASRKSPLLERRLQRLDELRELMGQGRAERLFYAARISRDSSALREAMALWLTWWRDLLLVAHGSTAALTHQDRKADLFQLAEKLRPEQARQAVEAIRAAIRGLDSNANPRLTAEVLMLNLPTI